MNEKDDIVKGNEYCVNLRYSWGNIQPVFYGINFIFTEKKYLDILKNVFLSDIQNMNIHSLFQKSR